MLIGIAVDLNLTSTQGKKWANTKGLPRYADCTRRSKWACGIWRDWVRTEPCNF